MTNPFNVENVEYLVKVNIDLIGYFFDRLRIVPRVVIFGYMWLVYDTITWAKGLPDISTQQAGVVAAVVGFAAPLFAFYVNASTMLKGFTKRSGSADKQNEKPGGPTA